MKLIELQQGEMFGLRRRNYKEYKYTYGLGGWMESCYSHIVWTTNEYMNEDELNNYIIYYSNYDCLFIMYRSNYTFGIMAKKPFDIDIKI